MTRRGVTALAIAAVAIVGLSAAAPALASSGTQRSEGSESLPPVWTQSSGQKSIPVPGPPNDFVPVDSSPGLPVGHYDYTMVIDINNVAPGSEVLCGEQVRPTGGRASGDYGIVDNTAGSVPISGHCFQSGVVNITKPDTKMSFWTTVYSGSTGADVFGWSMTETKVGTVTFSS